MKGGSINESTETHFSAEAFKKMERNRRAAARLGLTEQSRLYAGGRKQNRS
ncbi:MAG: hypothetical protein PUC26_01540 [Eubacteriales bacterium]|nr:hypothetical protein [Eubacteriales bacterium]